MKKTRDEILSEALIASIGTLSRFYGDQSLKNLSRQVQAKKKPLRLVLWLVVLLGRTQLGLSLMLIIAVFTFPRNWFCREQREIYAVSLTQNNHRAIWRVAGLDRRIADKVQINDRPMPFFERFSALRSIRLTASNLFGSGSQDPFVFLNEICAAACIHLFFEDLKRSNPKLVIVANDHSAPTVALCSLARTLDKKTCYIQHGPVTDNFPPLDYDLSILFSEAAKAVYDASADRNGSRKAENNEICILPEFDRPFSEISVPSEPLNANIALSYFSNVRAVKLTIEQMLRDTRISKISIKQHPRSTADLKNLVSENVEVLPKKTSITEIARSSDFCVVSNSGVALAYLHHGCPTFYKNLELDTPQDYYGFVAKGITPDYVERLPDNIHELSGFFDEDWRERMAFFDPTIANSIETLEATTVSKLLRLFNE